MNASTDALVAGLTELGFRRVASRRAGEWSLQASPYLVYTVMLDDDGSLLFTWELTIGELMHGYGLQIGSNEALNLFLFPQHDARGPADIAFVVQEMERTERILAGVDLVRGR